MWIHTNYGFFSVVKNHSKHSSLEFVIRARVREHLEKTHIFNEIVELEPCDYQYRMYVTKSQLVDWLLSVVDNIDYDNFKDSIKDQQLKEFCSNVWVAGVFGLGKFNVNVMNNDVQGCCIAISSEKTPKIDNVY